jgi:hypothetical protein
VTRSQRLTFLAVAAVIAAVAVVGLSGGSDDASEEQAASQATTATPMAAPESTGMADAGESATTAAPEATPAPRPRPRPRPVLLTASGDPKTVRGTEGERVRFRIRSAVDEEVHVHGYDITRALPAGRVVTVTIPDATLTGIYEIELHGSGVQIGSLRIDPS